MELAVIDEDLIGVEEREIKPELPQMSGFKPTHKQKVNVRKADPSTLIGIVRKLLLQDISKKAQKRITVTCHGPLKNKDFQRFYARVDRDEWLIQSNNTSNVWVASKN